MIINNKRKWPRKNGEYSVKIAFQDGTLDQQKMVQDAVKEWEKCNVKFYWVKNTQDSDVRITFDSKGGHSECGTNALTKSKNVSTLQLNGKEKDNEFKRHVLHEFGHMLGAQHEHFSPHFPFNWNEVPIKNYWKERLGNSIKVEDKLKGDITYRLTQDELHYHMVSKFFDDKSIMLYYIPDKNWLVKRNGFPNAIPRVIKGNYHLSEEDKALMRKAYPL